MLRASCKSPMQKRIAMRRANPMDALITREPTIARGTVMRGVFISSERWVAESYPEQ